MPVRAVRSENVATITFSRVERRNSLDEKIMRELHDAVAGAVADPEVRAILFTAEGDAFCTGADVKEFAARADDVAAFIRSLAPTLHATIDLLHRGPKPVVTAVNGDAAGGGFGLALAGDVRIAAEAARFRPAYFRIGLTPDGGLTYFLARYAGLSAAQRILLLDETLSAEGARAVGLVHRVVPAARLAEEARAAARTLAAWSPASVAGTKELLGHAWDRASTAQMAKEAEAIERASSTANFREGVRAFTEKRPPRFR